ncbi:hypothetical protein TruAng_006117 [Truncatella angustata]|nr:hypothetical protein TruAng_006117 [Truncatella angustata]
MKSTVISSGAAALAGAHDFSFVSDPGYCGPALEIEHAYYKQWPTGIAVSSTGRKFSNYPGGLDLTNVCNGSNNVFTVGGLTSVTTETAYPSLKINQPPGGAINYTTSPPSRVLTPDGQLVYTAYGGPKLVRVDLSTDQVFKTIVFTQTVAYSNSYLNDVRFDLREEVSESGEGIAYVTDSSFEGRNGIIIVDLGSGKSWRHSDIAHPVRFQSQFLPFI